MSERPIAFVNAASGTGADDPDVADWCTRIGAERRDFGDDLAASIADAASARPPFVAIVGGDGTMRTAVGVLTEHDVALLPAPGGTFNHFAKSVGIADLAEAERAVLSGAEQSVPVAEVNGEVFLNTCAIGWYPEMVRTRESLRERMPRPVAALGAFVVHLPRLRRFDVDLDGTTHRAWLLWAGNGRFGTGPTDLAEREDLTEGVLDVRLALADRRFARTRVVIDLIRGRLRHSDLVERVVTSDRVTVRVRPPALVAALDAEVVDLTSPLVFTPAARHIRVRTP